MSPLGLTLGGFAATVLAGIFGYLGARLARASSRESNTTDNWAEMFKANEAQLERMEESIEKQDVKIGQQDERINRLENMLRDEQRRFRQAIGFIRDLLRWIEHHVPGQQPPSVPDALKEEV